MTATPDRRKRLRDDEDDAEHVAQLTGRDEKVRRTTPAVRDASQSKQPLTMVLIRNLAPPRIRPLMTFGVTTIPS
jgi:hypothetical protein